jgi:hypothetical protein
VNREPVNGTAAFRIAVSKHFSDTLVARQLRNRRARSQFAGCQPAER